jgi:hypothetical protein
MKARVFQAIFRPAHPSQRIPDSERVHLIVLSYRPVSGIVLPAGCRLQAAAGQSEKSMQSNLGTLASWLATDYCLQMPGILGDPHWPVGMLTNLTR